MDFGTSTLLFGGPWTCVAGGKEADGLLESMKTVKIAIELFFITDHNCTVIIFCTVRKANNNCVQ